MKMDMSMTTDKDQFTVSSWWATDPEFVIESLCSQLAAAAVIWPELTCYYVGERLPGKAGGGAKGGNARAVALSPERRAEIAKAAADARWRKEPDDALPGD